jgi:hypothetical protein
MDPPSKSVSVCFTDLRRRFIDLAQVLRREIDIHRAEILLQPGGDLPLLQKGQRSASSLLAKASRQPASSY